MAGYQVNGMPLMMHELADERVQWFQQNGNRQQRLEAAEILRERQAEADWIAAQQQQRAQMKAQMGALVDKELRRPFFGEYQQDPGYLVDRELARPFPKTKNSLGVLAE